MTPLQDEFEAHLKAMPDWAPEFEVHRPWVEKLLLDAWNAATELAAKKEREDSKRLDWIVRQADEFSCTVIVDAPGDGDYIVHGMDGWGQGKIAREAIDNAMQFNAAAIRARDGKGAA